MKYEKGSVEGFGVLFAVLMVAGLIGAWVTHIVVCLKAGLWGFLIAGAICFPIGIIHGIGIWFGIW